MQVKICDRCKQQTITLRNTTVGSRAFELCPDCSENIINWIESGQTKKGFMGNLGKMIGV